ncbi:hypothetical protein [Deinococcus cellulosilyticus]|uniref:Uncharacterized protein n=1 Tax=Deinococcus cellulosilyticus (strain DSM 18568 / NBRC 106333 / KACC 11606 / 5516J-15) TaxID=1223518 RepID=A0A511N9F7_DEIC1|nr:hypothetical protein [Deinococcus cellulosilyticus]GEM49187.1 hypothetical protein DC3_48220 [Deinococcus cellulosilyticus NBRC 106333 = KACC 11606]
MTNPFVAYLNRYTTASPEHEAAFDEFTSNSRVDGIEPLSLDTEVGRKLFELFDQDHPPAVILTGNAGDGKTYLCRKIIEKFTGQKFAGWDRDAVKQDFYRQGHPLRVIKDLSEMGIESSGVVLKGLHRRLLGMPSMPFLIAANEGRLRAQLASLGLPELQAEVDRQLQEGPDPSKPVLVIDLNRIPTSSYIPQVLSWMTDPDRWEACGGCAAKGDCPILHNARKLQQPRIQQRVLRLYEVLEHLEHHITVRDQLVHMAFTVTGGLSCQKVRAQRGKPSEWRSVARQYAYYNNLWGEAATETFRKKATALKLMNRLDVAGQSVFQVDHFIISDHQASEQPEYRQVFEPAIDLGHTLFQQERASYLLGDQLEQAVDFVKNWLPFCRRKVFFEWHDEDAVLGLLPFQHLGLYLKLLEDRKHTLKAWQVRKMVLGLNRAFSGLFVQETDHLYVTSHYGQGARTSIPIIRQKIPYEQLDLEVNAETQNFMPARPQMTLQITNVKLSPEPVRWKVNLLRFEYVMRRASGGTSNVLSEECDLDIRHLKDELLTRFQTGPTGDHIEFFELTGSGYRPQVLRLPQEVEA